MDKLEMKYAVRGLLEELVNYKLQVNIIQTNDKTAEINVTIDKIS